MLSKQRCKKKPATSLQMVRISLIDEKLDQQKKVEILFDFYLWKMILFQNNFNKMKVEILFDFYLWKIALFQHTYYVLVLGFI